MADFGLALAWGVPVRGREQKALEVFMEGQEVFDKAQANSEISGFETVLFQASGGGLPGGHTIAWGSEDQIDALARSDGFIRLGNRAGLIVDGVAVGRCVRGEALATGIGGYGAEIAGLT